MEYASPYCFHIFFYKITNYTKHSTIQTSWLHIRHWHLTFAWRNITYYLYTHTHTHTLETSRIMTHTLHPHSVLSQSIQHIDKINKLHSTTANILHTSKYTKMSHLHTSNKTWSTHRLHARTPVPDSNYCRLTLNYNKLVTNTSNSTFSYHNVSITN